MRKRPTDEKITVSTKRVFIQLLLLIIGLTLLSIISTFSVKYFPDYPLRDLFEELFSVDREKSLPTFYSAYALQACAFLLYIISYLTKAYKDKYLRHWQLLSLIFFYLSLDEALALHERTVSPLKESLNTDGFLYFPWVIPATFLVVVFLLGYLTFLLALPTKIKRLFLMSGGIFVLGALGMEMVGGKASDMGLGDSAAYIFLFTCEEFLEMFGILVFLYALLSFLRMKLSSVEISLTR